MRRRVIGALTISVLLIMGALRVADLWRSREETLQTAETRAANLAFVLSEYMAESMAAGDAALRQVAVYNRRVGGPQAPDAEWIPILQSARAGLSGIGSLSIIDTSGVVRHSTRSDLIGVSRRDNYIVEALKSPDDEFIVGVPVRALVTPFNMLIPIARRLTDAKGNVEGAVVASFIPSESRQFFQSVDVGRAGIIWIFHRGGVVLFREPSPQEHTGESAEGNPIFKAASAAGGTGAVRAVVEPGGPEMLTGYHVSKTQPFIVAVSLDRAERLETWRADATASVTMFAVATVLLGVTLALLFATLRREQSARAQAESASALKDEFLMTVSHELRTPLTAISGWARMLVDGMVTDEQKRAALQTIERNARAQTRLIDDLLDVSGIMSGKLHLEQKTVQVADVVQAAVDAVRPMIEAKSLRLDTDIDTNAGTINGDPERLQQVVWNLLSNAAKFTPNGGRVSLAVRRRGPDVEIAVADTGAGISPDFLPHVFERFRQQHGGPSRKFGGLGLGLTIVRNLVELHGGTVAAHSDGDGKGATFTVRLPAQ